VVITDRRRYLAGEPGPGLPTATGAIIDVLGELAPI
jgi:hypothetical protein